MLAGQEGSLADSAVNSGIVVRLLTLGHALGLVPIVLIELLFGLALHLALPVSRPVAVPSAATPILRLVFLNEYVEHLPDTHSLEPLVVEAVLGQLDEA